MKVASPGTDPRKGEPLSWPPRVLQTVEHWPRSLLSAQTQCVTSTWPPRLQSAKSGHRTIWSRIPFPLRGQKSLHYPRKAKLSSYSRKPQPEKCVLTFTCLQKINKIKSVSFKCCWLGCHGYHLIMKDDSYLFPWKHRAWGTSCNFRQDTKFYLSGCNAQILMPKNRQRQQPLILTSGEKQSAQV